MKAIIINLLKSFWLSKGKFLLCIVAAVLSAWGISTMLYSKAMTACDFKANFTASNPADIILTVRNPTTTTLQQLSSHNKVAAVQRRETITARIKNKKDSWMSVLLFSTNDIKQPLINKFTITGEANNNTLFIESNGLGFIDTSKPFLIQLPGLDTIIFNYGGKAYDPGLPPSQMEQMVYGYANLSSLKGVINDSVQHWLITIKEKGLKEEALRVIAKELSQAINQTAKVSGYLVPPPGEHPHQNIVNGISFLLKSFGAVLSVLGVTLLSLILITWLYPQMVNVGIMKTVGASTRMVFGGYMIVLLLIIFIGLVIGMPLGYVTGKAYSRFIDFVQNFKPVDTPLPLSNHLMVLLPTVFVPVLFTATSLIRVSRTTVYNALNKVFYTPYQFIFKLTNTLFANTAVKYSVNNLFRNNLRTLLLLLLLVAGVGLFTAGFNLRHSLKKDFENYVTNSTYGITVIIKDSLNKELSFLNQLACVEDVKYIKNSSVQFKAAGKSYYENAVISIFPKGYIVHNDLVLKGRVEPEQINKFYISQKYEDDFKNIQLGDTVELKNQNGSAESFVFGGVIKNITHPGFYRYAATPRTAYNEIAIKIKKDYPAEKATQQIDDALLNNEVEVKQIADNASKLLMLENHLKPTYLIIQIMGVITLLIAIGGLMIVLNLTLQERVREMGIMKAVGGSVKSTVSMYHREYLVLSIMALVAGIIFGSLLNAAICKLFGVMVIMVPVKPIADINFIILAIVSLLAVQTLLISVYIKNKVAGTSANMQSQVF
ncbi:MAG: ABC transporter permease [Sphingobacteriales bacterium]|nr:ABC transporter permease [Sphingobacteriales bacterium]